MGDRKGGEIGGEGREIERKRMGESGFFSEGKVCIILTVLSTESWIIHVQYKLV